MQQNDYYLVLEIPSSATADQIKAAYRRLSKRYHPDLNPGDLFCEEKFKELQQAYEVLSDATLRQEYDLHQAGNYNKINNEKDNTNSTSKSGEPELSEFSGEASIIRFAVLGIMFIIFFSRECNQPAQTDNYRVLTPAETVAYETGNKARRKRFEDSLKRVQGRVFVYTNNSEVTAVWHHSYDQQNIGEVRSIINDNDQQTIDKSWELMVQYDGRYYSFDHTINYYNDSTYKLLNFIGYYDKKGIEEDDLSATVQPLEFSRWRTAFGIGISGMEQITTKHLNVVHMDGCLLFLKKIEGFQFIMVGKEKDIERPGMSLDEFERSIKVINKLLKKEGVDTSQFKMKIFNEIE